MEENHHFKWNLEKNRRDVAFEILTGHGVGQESITSAMVDAEWKSMQAGMGKKIQALETPQIFVKKQGVHTDYPHVVNKLFIALKLSLVRYENDTELMVVDGYLPHMMVGININDLAPVFELDAAKSRRVLENTGFTLDKDGLLTDHPHYRPQPRDYSATKLTAKIAFAAINVITLCNSFMLADHLIGKSKNIKDGFISAGAGVIAPVITGVNWENGFDSESYDWGGTTPVAVIGGASGKVFPKPADRVINFVFSAASAPGAWVGHLAGSAYGALTFENEEPDDAAKVELKAPAL